MNIMFKCGACNGQSEGVLRKRTDYANTTNLDELDICCTFCGNLLGRTYSSRKFIDDKQNEILDNNKKEIKDGK